MTVQAAEEHNLANRGTQASCVPCETGALLTCAVMGASVIVPVTQATVVPQLALAGLGLGIFVPANNTMIMRGAADSSASLVGGLVSMARGSAPRSVSR